MQVRSKLFIYSNLIMAGAFCSCSKLVTVPPPAAELASSSVYSGNASAASVLTGIYERMSAGGFSTGINSISLLCGLSGDELTNYSTNPPFPQVYTNSLLSTNVPFWIEFYQYIYTANAALKELSSSTNLSVPVKQQLTGEAEFIRAFCNFYLVNLWGDVPLITTSNYQATNLAARTPVTQVYAQIISDLKDAKNLLSVYFLSADAATVTIQRTRPTKWAASALLARAYLYAGDWLDAGLEADSIINDASQFSLVNNLDSVFLANSNEAIWQLQPVTPNLNTLDAYAFILTSGPNPYQNPVSLSTFQLESFEPGDARYTSWVRADSSTGTTYYYPYKYKVGYGAASVTEYLMVFRLAEQYLILAEAEARQGDLSHATANLNKIRGRANLPQSGASLQNDLVSAILKEKRNELFTEWGHRWLDLKRTDSANQVMGQDGVCAAKGGIWNPDWQLYPIPLSDIQKDPNLTQNSGYQ